MNDNTVMDESLDQVLTRSNRAVRSVQAFLFSHINVSTFNVDDLDAARVISRSIQDFLSISSFERIRQIRLQAAPLLRELERTTVLLLRHKTALQNKIIRATKHRSVITAYEKGKKVN